MAILRTADGARIMQSTVSPEAVIGSCSHVAPQVPYVMTQLSPYVPTLFAALEFAVRTVLGLKENVGITHRTSRHGGGKVVEFTVNLPNGINLDMSLRPAGQPTHPLETSDHLILSLRSRPDVVDPATDPATAPSVEAIQKLFRVHQRRFGVAHTAALWEAWDAVAKWNQLDDAYFRRILHGVTGLSANLRLGFRCNQNCHFCWQGRSWPEPPVEMYFKWLDELAAAGVRQLAVTGGEPTLHTSLPELLARAKAHGMFVMMQTNAVMLSKPKILAKLKVDRIFVSFHAADSAISDIMTRAPGTHVKTVKGIQAALGSGLAVSLNCLIERENVQNVAAHAQFIVDHFVTPFPENPVRAVTYSRPQTYFDGDLHRSSLVSVDEMEPQVLQAVRTLMAAGVHPDVTAGTCGLASCLFRSIPEVIDLPEAEYVGEADPAFATAERLPACQQCALRHRCQGPGHGYGEKFGDRGLVPFETMPTLTVHPRPVPK